MAKIVFIDVESSGPGREALDLVMRVAGPSWLVDAESLRAGDLDGAAIVAVGGALRPGSPERLSSSLAALAGELAAPVVAYSTHESEPGLLSSLAASLASVLGRDCAARIDVAGDPALAGRALRDLRDARPQARRLGEAELRARVDAFLAAHRTCALGSVSERGDPRVTPIEYLWRNGSFLFFSEGGLKFAGLADGAAASLCVYDEYSSMAAVKGLQATGRCRLLPDGSAEWSEAFAARGVDPRALAAHRLRLNVVRLEPELIELLDAGLREEGADSRQVLRLRGPERRLGGESSLLHPDRA